jgi:hypothetical protein
VVLWAATLVPLISVGSSSERLVEAFATDEAMQLNLLHGAASKHTFALTFGPYGHFVFNLILLALRIIPGELSDARIVQTGRSISVFFAAATLFLTFVWTRRVFGAAAAWIALSVLLVNATLYAWAVALEPDMAQLFFLVLALALTCRFADEPRIRGWRSPRPRRSGAPSEASILPHVPPRSDGWPPSSRSPCSRAAYS